MKSAAHVFTFKIGGEAGFGIMSAGLVFSKLVIRSGYFAFNYTEYPSLIRGGHNVMQTSVSYEPVYSQYSTTDFLVALNQETIDLHKAELTNGAYVLYDADSPINVESLPSHIKKFGVPLTHLVRQADGSMVMRNAAALASAVALLGGDLAILKALLDEGLSGKNQAIIDMNHKVCDIAHDYVLNNDKDLIQNILALNTKHAHDQIILTGNEACSLGALAGGMNFVSIYPMTPTSNILHTLSPLQKEYGFVYKQPEDEISAINMALGAAFAGARSMVATSGGGFCLMSEAYGLAGITETPVVIVEGMRGAPATGLPTWTEQGDLKFVLYAHQGDFPRIVLAPGDINEAFESTMLAFNLAEKYQTPVLILVDKYLCESHMSVAPFEYSSFEIDRGKLSFDNMGDDYMRYKFEDDGISLRTVPGTGNHFLANSDEHNVYGYSNEESINRIEQMDKRMQKLLTCEQNDMQGAKKYGPEDADITIVSWGSNKGPILEAIKVFENVNFIDLLWINPFPTEQVTLLLKKAKHLLNIECNYTGQMRGYIKEKTGVDIQDNFLKYDGRPFYPEEIIAKLQSIGGR